MVPHLDLLGALLEGTAEAMDALVACHRSHRRRLVGTEVSAATTTDTAWAPVVAVVVVRRAHLGAVLVQLLLRMDGWWDMCEGQ